MKKTNKRQTPPADAWCLVCIGGCARSHPGRQVCDGGLRQVSPPARGSYISPLLRFSILSAHSLVKSNPYPLRCHLPSSACNPFLATARASQDETHLTIVLQTLRQAPRTPSFAETTPVIDGVKMAPPGKDRSDVTVRMRDASISW